MGGNKFFTCTFVFGGLKVLLRRGNMDEAEEEMEMSALEELNFLDSCRLSPFFISDFV